MRVRDLMTASPATCTIHDSLNHAARILWERDCGFVPVLDDEGQVVGTVTDRDICMAAYTQGKRLSELPITTVMPDEVFSCSPDDSSEVAESIMQRHQVRRLPVIDRAGKLVGVLSVNDLATKHAPPRDVAKTLAAICQPRVHATAA